MREPKRFDRDVVEADDPKALYGAGLVLMDGAPVGSSPPEAAIYPARDGSHLHLEVSGDCEVTIGFAWSPEKIDARDALLGLTIERASVERLHALLGRFLGVPQQQETKTDGATQEG
jgi:hypothetical protein